MQRRGTALIAASMNGHTETVKCLIEANAQIDLQHEASIHHLTVRSLFNIEIFENLEVTNIDNMSVSFP